MFPYFGIRAVGFKMTPIINFDTSMDCSASSFSSIFQIFGEKFFMTTNGIRVRKSGSGNC